MIDRPWWLWQQNGNSTISPDLMDIVLQPFNIRVRNVLNINDLGYEYAAAQNDVPVGGTG